MGSNSTVLNVFPQILRFLLSEDQSILILKGLKIRKACVFQPKHSLTMNFFQKKLKKRRCFIVLSMFTVLLDTFMLFMSGLSE